jgi:tetratricopeptide (TPR) repeat protein
MHPGGRTCWSRRWTRRLSLAVLALVLLLGAVEAGLRIGGYGYSTSFFLLAPAGGMLTANREFVCQFYGRANAPQPLPFLMSPWKAPGTIRIFVLGESGAAGTPAPAFGFARILRVILGEQYPGRRFEVINTALPGINSHIVRRIARECARFEPDAFIVYMGNDEAAGLYTPGAGGASLPRFLEWARATKLAQLLDAGFGQLRRRAGPRTEPRDMAFFRSRRLAANDPRRQQLCRDFQSNLQAICQTASRARAKVILSTVPVNLRDFPPLASLHRPDLTDPDRLRWEAALAAAAIAEHRQLFPAALDLYRAAAQIDDHYAELHFRMAERYEATGQLEKAREQFILARDWDALPFRADDRLNNIVRATGHRRSEAGGRLIDLERAFAQSEQAPGGVPGARLFLDHVRFTFDGHYLAARALLPVVAEALALGKPAAAPLSRDQCAERLAFTVWDEINLAAATARMTSHPPFVDQLEHAARQTRAELALSNRLSRLAPREAGSAAGTYRQAVGRGLEDWPHGGTEPSPSRKR